MDIAVGEQYGAHASRVTHQEELGDGTAAVVRNDVHGIDLECVQQVGEHVRLGHW